MADSNSPPPSPPLFFPRCLPQPNHMDPPTTPPPPRPCVPNFFKRRPAVRVTSEFDSDRSIILHKVSCKFFGNLAKLKLSFQNDYKGQVSKPHLTFISKLLSVRNQTAHLKGSFDLGPNLHFDVKAQKGQVAVLAKLPNLGYALEVSSSHFQSIGSPRATLKFPVGEVYIQKTKDAYTQKTKDEQVRPFYVRGVVKGQILNLLCTGQFTNDDLELRYAFKDEGFSLISSISLPSKDVTMEIKHRFSPNNKLSYCYDFESDSWSAVYKQTYGKDYKFKAGYDSQFHNGWASLSVGDEGGKAKTAPMQMNAQLILHFTVDDIRSPALMLRVKKRWDI